jgi:drug/metabolite transporter (DMT)-like permease
MPHIFLVLGVLVVSTAPPLVRLAQPVPPIVVAFGRVALAAVILLALSGRQLREIPRLPRKVAGITILAGVALGLHFALWISSFELTSTAAAVSLVATQPVFAGLLGMAFLGEGFATRELWGIALAVLGCAVLAGGDFGGSSAGAVVGDGLAVLAAVMVSGYLLAGRALRERLSLLPFLALVNAVAAVPLLVAALATQASFSGFAASDYLGVALLGLGPSALGHSLLNYCVRRVPVHLVSLGILAEPVIGSLATWIFFGERPPGLAVLGGAIIVAGIYFGFGARRGERT